MSVSPEQGNIIDPIPDYLRDVYTWAYLTPWLAKILDRQIVVQTILWGNAQKLIGDVISEIKPGDRVFQPAAVYGTFSRQVAERVGGSGHLDICDIAPLQITRTRLKLASIPQVYVAWGDAAKPKPKDYDAVACFFLLHEVPDEVKVNIVTAMLSLVRPGGKAIFVDYHQAHSWHPLKRMMKKIFERLEPFALSMWSQEIASLAGPLASSFQWHKRTRFGGLYQIVIAEKS